MCVGCGCKMGFLPWFKFKPLMFRVLSFAINWNALAGAAVNCDSRKVFNAILWLTGDALTRCTHTHIHITYTELPQCHNDRE